uniref:Uncharacterized protein n=1 Tax=Ixodes ricinus TaxID=34613 RepID=A0A6B0U4K2_IXORI
MRGVAARLALRVALSPPSAPVGGACSGRGGASSPVGLQGTLGRGGCSSTAGPAPPAPDPVPSWVLLRLLSERWIVL